jgi:glycosyltransferase involved in cell wall biosynthesis
VYNGERFLREALDSLLAQTFTDFELIVRDNASSDGTGDICRAYASRDRRIRYERNATNIGVHRNCNRVFQLAVGKYFKLAAADDVCHPELLSRCVQVLEDDPTIVCAYGKVRFIDKVGCVLPLTDPGWHLMSYPAEERLRRVIVSGHWVNVFFGLSRSHELARTRLFAPYANGDYRLLAEMSLRGKFFEIPEYLFFRRLHADAASQNSDPDWQTEFFKSEETQLPFWSLCFDYARTILSSELSAQKKMSCVRSLGERILSGRHQLLGELHLAWKSLSR